MSPFDTTMMYVIMFVWFVSGVIVGLNLNLLSLITRPRHRALHVHRAYRWDGYFERCKCGASAGDKRLPNGSRCISFSDWPK